LNGERLRQSGKEGILAALLGEGDLHRTDLPPERISNHRGAISKPEELVAKTHSEHRQPPLRGLPDISRGSAHPFGRFDQRERRAGNHHRIEGFWLPGKALPGMDIDDEPVDGSALERLGEPAMVVAVR
jgi:hypothetical protein